MSLEPSFHNAVTLPSVAAGLGSMLARKLQGPVPSVQDLVAQQHGRIPELAEP